MQMMVTNLCVRLMTTGKHFFGEREMEKHPNSWNTAHGSEAPQDILLLFCLWNVCQSIHWNVPLTYKESCCLCVSRSSHLPYNKYCLHSTQHRFELLATKLRSDYVDGIYLLTPLDFWTEFKVSFDECIMFMNAVFIFSSRSTTYIQHIFYPVS